MTDFTSVPDGPRVTEPGAAFLRGGALPAAVAAVLVTAAGVPSGGAAVAGAAVGSVLAVVSLAPGPLLLRRSATWSPPAVMAAAVGSFGVIVMLLGLAFAVLGEQSWLSSGHLAVALVVVTSAWLAGQVRAAARLRSYAFDPPGASPPPSGDAPQR